MAPSSNRRGSLPLCILASAVLLAAGEISCDSDKFGKFEIFDNDFGHPLHKYLLDHKMTPFPVAEYFFQKGKDMSQQMGTELLAGSGSYRMTEAPFDEGNLVTNADAIIAQWRDLKPESFAVRTRQVVEVIVVLQFKGHLNATQTKDPKLVNKDVADWNMIGSVERTDGPGKNYFEGKANKQGVAISKKMEDKESYIGHGLFDMKIPNVRMLQIAGLPTPTGYVVLFVDPKTRKALPYPGTPETLGLAKPIEPHSECPKALHDEWKTVSDDDLDPDNYVDGDIASQTMIKHTTWHPVIDPVYFCTYGHSHGSYPGRYKPSFTHTAHKTTEEVKDASGKSTFRRQVESDEGFKVFTMFEESERDDGTREWLHWIFVVHMELNNARRFSARHHTVHVTVFDHKFKQVMAKLQMKNDYGAASTRTNKGIEPLNKEMKAIEDERKKAGKSRAFRQVNLRTRSSDCTMSGQTLLMVPTDMGGHQEHWVAPLNTCSKRSFKVDVRRPRTGLKTCATEGESMQVDYLNGPSIDSAFTSNHFEVGYGNCDWRADVDAGGKGPNLRFYTDPFFSEILLPIEEAIAQKLSTKNYMVQEMHPGFSAKLPQGRYEESDFFQGKYVRKGTANGRKHGALLEPWMVLGMEN